MQRPTDIDREARDRSDVERTAARLAELRGFGTAAVRWLVAIPGLLVRGLVRVYRYSLSSLVGRTCRHLPTCSEYADTAIGRFGLWRGGWMATARFWRCRPFGSSGFDPVPETLPERARWYRPWRYGLWGSDLPD